MDSVYKSMLQLQQFSNADARLGNKMDNKKKVRDKAEEEEKNDNKSKKRKKARSESEADEDDNSKHHGKSEERVIDDVEESGLDNEMNIEKKRKLLDQKDDKAEEEQREDNKANTYDLESMKVKDNLKRWMFPSKSLIKTLTKNLEDELGIKYLFEIQKSGVDAIMSTHIDGNDICISAPTGSGKTLIYVLAILRFISTRIVKRIRALVVVPTKELSLQVKKVFDAVIKNVNLENPISVALSSGYSSFEQDEETIIDKNTKQFVADILIATPGRLVDHIDRTEGFTLEHLRFLVVDEADRLLSGGYNDWIYKLFRSVYSAMNTPRDDSHASNDVNNEFIVNSDATKQNFQHSIRGLNGSNVRSLQHCFSGGEELWLRRILCSATLTNDPRQISQLDLRQPVYISGSTSNREKIKKLISNGNENGTNQMMHLDNGNHPIISVDDEDLAIQYKFPELLVFHTWASTEELKPLTAIRVLYTDILRQGKRILIFTANIESAHRLVALLRLIDWNKLGKLLLPDEKEHLKPIEHTNNESFIMELSSVSSNRNRGVAIKKIESGEARIVVATDLAARGVDIENLEAVMNYDMPTGSKAFVHRVGRTARAGKTGDAYSLIIHEKLGLYRTIVNNGNGKIGDIHRLKRSEATNLKEYYTECVNKMKSIISKSAT